MGVAPYQNPRITGNRTARLPHTGGGDRTRTCTGLPLNGFLDRGSTNYAYSSISGQYLLCASPCPGLPVFCHGPAALPCRVANEDAIFTYWNRDIPGWVPSRPRSPTQAYDLFFSIFLILYHISLINLYFVYFGGATGTRTQTTFAGRED